MTNWEGEIHVHGRVYTFSRHWRDKPEERKEANKEEIRYVLLEPSHRRLDGPRRTVYWRYIYPRGKYMRVVEDRLPAGEYQVLTAYPDDEVEAEWEIQ